MYSQGYTHKNSHHADDDWDEVHRQMIEVQEMNRIQKKSLTISDPGDADEKEADEIARKVTGGESAEVHGSNGAINRKANGNAEAGPEFQSQLSASKGAGQSLPENLQQELGGKMHADLSNVKIHTGSEAHTMNEQVNAKAFTHGQDVYFREGEYNPASSQGKELLAHELAHTVQQGKVPQMIQRGGPEVSKEEQARLKSEFDLYQSYKLRMLDNQIANETDPDAKAKLQKGRDKFEKKAKSFSNDMDEDSAWGSSKYKRKLKNRFEDYEGIIAAKRVEVKNSIAVSVAMHTTKLDNAITLIQEAINLADTDAATAQRLLLTAQAELAATQISRTTSGTALGTEDATSDESGILTQYDIIIQKYNDMIILLQNNIDDLGNDKQTFNVVLQQLNEQKTHLNEINTKADTLTDVVQLVSIEQKELPELRNSIDNSTAMAGLIKRPTAPVDENEKLTEIQGYKDQVAGLESEIAVKQAQKQKWTKDPSSLKEEQILILTTVTFYEGGYDWSMRDIVWVYINNTRRLGFEGAMKTSSQYSNRGPFAKVVVHTKLYYDTLKKVQDENANTSDKPLDPRVRKLLNYVRQVLQQPEDNPFPSFNRQGYWGDLNRDDNEKPRAYLLLWLQGKVDGRLMEVIGSGFTTSFLWEDAGIYEYFEDNPSMLPSPVPGISVSQDGKTVEMIHDKKTYTIKATHGQ